MFTCYRVLLSSLEFKLIYIACEVSVFVGLRSKESLRKSIFDVLLVRKMKREPKKGKKGRVRQETLVDKPWILKTPCLPANMDHDWLG